MTRPWIQVGDDRTWADDSEVDHNSALNAARNAVEWSHKDLKKMWSIQDYKRKLNVLKNQISLMEKATAFLRNFEFCLQHGDQTQENVHPQLKTNEPT